MFRACSGREQSTRIARAAPEPTRRAPGSCPLCSATPRAPLLTATRQAALAAYSTAVRALGGTSASAARLGQVGAAQAASACHLPPGAVRAHPQLRPLACVAATSP